MKEKKTDRKLPGKDQGLSFRQCLARGRLYSREVPGLLPYVYIVPYFFAWLVLDFTLRFTYRGMGIVGVKYLPACLFTLGWALIFSGLVFFLPKIPRWFVRCVPLVTCVVLVITHSGFMSMFNRFFSFSILAYGGTGSFMEASYIRIDWRVIAGAAVAVVLMMLAGRLLAVVPPKPVKASVLAGVLAFLVGVGLVAFTHVHYFPQVETVIWENTDKDAQSIAYHEMNDTTNALMVSGLYQYTVRDLCRQIFPQSTMSDSDRELVDSYVADYEAAETTNDYTGRFAGKNVIMVQLEAIDTWMLDNYMPNLKALKDQGISFTNHYTPAYITAGTFNTEFMANTGLMPATGGIPTSVYTNNAYPYSLANLFTQAGYTANSFHNSEGTVYDRGNIHLNLGYQAYHSGSDMAMENYQMDRYLINGFDEMTAADPFFSFVITYSGHGPYGDDSAIYQANAEQAQAAAQRTDGNYVYAVAGAMETDRFIQELMEKLEESGHLEDTVLVFYADHYNYYMMDDGLNMEIKGVDNMNMLQHTDFFIWSADIEEPVQVDKVTSTLDILPTLANLFGLDTTGAFLAGHDGLGDQGGYVFFADGSWYDGTTYWSSKSEGGDAARTAEINKITSLNSRVLAGNYYSEN